MVHFETMEFQKLVNGEEMHGLDITWYNQPVHNPDLNVLDLGVFTAIQARYHQNPPKTFDEVVEKVEISFAQLSGGTIDN